MQCFLSNADCIDDSMWIRDCSFTCETLRNEVICRSEWEAVVESSLISLVTYHHLAADKSHHTTWDTKRIPVGRQLWQTDCTAGTDK